MSWTNRHRELARRHSERKEANGGGKDFKPWAMERLDLNVGETFLARFIYPDGFPYTKVYHWPQGKPPLTCTADIPIFEDPETRVGRCNYCEAYPPKSRGQRKSDDVFEVIDFRYLHIVPDEKRGGDAETVETCAHSEPSDMIKRNRCRACNSTNPRIRERHFGGRKVVELKSYQYDQIWAAHEKLASTCVASTADGVCDKDTYLLCFICEGCEELLLSEEAAGSMSAPNLNQFSSSLQTCSNCGKSDYPYGIYACDGEGRTPSPSEVGKDLPEDVGHWVEQGSLFSKMLEVTVAGQSKKMRDGKTITLRNLNISTGAEWSTLEEDLLSFGFDEEAIEEMKKPIDMAEKYRPSYKIKREDFSNDEAYVQAVLAEQAATAGLNTMPQSRGGVSGGRRSFRSS